MQRPLSLLVDAWREVGRHTGIQEALEALTPELRSQLPVASVSVRALDTAHRALVTVAHVGPGRRHGRTPLSPGAWARLLAWGARGSLRHGSASALRRRLGAVASEGRRGDLLIGPLLGANTLQGVAILAATPHQRFSTADVRRTGALLEPLAAALANQQRDHETQALRQAAEADRRALLCRLGRSDIAETLIGAEGGLAAAMERIALVARSDVPALLLGEAGSGKEAIARAIHRRSQRAPGPFVRVNCLAIPLRLMQVELFGHDPSGARRKPSSRRGAFERANGGTLLLDEVSALPLDAQARLLRVLRDGEVEGTRGGQPIRVDVRLIAATAVDLRRRVRRGAFREDLWTWLGAAQIEIPPLRERAEDVPALATHFALRACRRFGMRPLAPSPEEVELLAAYDWPGNVRELAAVMDRAVILGGGERLEVARTLGTAFGTPSERPPPGSAAAGGAILPLDRAMARHIEAALARCHGRIEGSEGAARLLEINPHTLRARMRKLGIDWRRFRANSSWNGRAGARR